LVDPMITVKPAQGQVPDLIEEIKLRVARNERVLVTTLTKRLAEDLANYMQELGIKGRYLHSEVQTVERVEILRDLREGKFDALVGVNLLREGLDLPEVSLVAILDADKEGFLRSATSLIQMIGRCARNVNATVYLYADRITDSMRQAIDETTRRREIQTRYNQENNITPEQVRKAVRESLLGEVAAMRRVREAANVDEENYDRDELVGELEREMLQAAEELDFEKAASLRDHIGKLKQSNEAKVAAADARPAFAGKARAAEGWKPRSQRRRPKKG
ncbi:MAG: UvrB/UvrC motif-containing protein, partial [Planctomycetes bacterium]|nr:UvrB/UvrC motif-containing protein [Planctomycetota bacterium]